MALPADDFELTGQAASTPAEAHDLAHAGFYPCRSQACNYFFHPYTSLIDDDGNTDCPGCKRQYNMNAVNPFSQYEQGDIRDEDPRTRHIIETPNGQLTYNVGGGTIAGLSLTEQGKLAEDIVEQMGELPGYGPITGVRSTYHSAADLACGPWAVEVKSANFDGKHLRFWPGSPTEKASRNERAEKDGYQGLLGVLVVLNFRDSEADVYVREMPFSGVMVNGRMKHGLYAYRSHTGQQLAARIPFSNPLLNPHQSAPQPDIPF
jgi:hypothetical protein